VSCASHDHPPPFPSPPRAAYYPRATLLNGLAGPAVATVATPTATEKRITLLTRVTLANGTLVWNATGTVVSDVDPTADLDNGIPFQRATDNNLLVAYRHHDGNGTGRVYRIQVSLSVNAGMQWSPLATIVSGPTGVWEPFLFNNQDGNLTVAYSAELTNGGEQDIVFQRSPDGGASWTPVMSRIHAAGCRNGMPGVTRAADGTLFVIFEQLTFATNQFTVQSMRSFDDGLTWTQAATVYAPPQPYDAGSPQIILCPVIARLQAVYMTNQPWDNEEEEGGEVAAGARGARLSWPDGAHLELRSTYLNGDNFSAPVTWNSSRAALPLATPTAYWPGFVLDISGVGRGVDGPMLSLRASYQGSDSAAYLSDGSLCLN